MFPELRDDKEISEWLDRIANLCEDLEKLGFDVAVELDVKGPILHIKNRRIYAEGLTINTNAKVSPRLDEFLPQNEADG